MMLHVHVCSLLIIITVVYDVACYVCSLLIITAVVYDVACSCMQSYNNHDSSL